jgi:hypothetical protein
MEDEHKRDKEIVRGDKAAAILNDELLKEAFKAVNDSYMHSWEHSGLEESDRRERMWMMSQNLKGVMLHLHTVVETGEMAKKQVATLSDDALVSQYEKKKWGI